MLATKVNKMSNFSVPDKSSEEIHKTDNLFKEIRDYKNVGNHSHGVSKFVIGPLYVRKRSSSDAIQTHYRKHMSEELQCVLPQNHFSAHGLITFSAIVGGFLFAIRFATS